jgi:hypothetical protein
MKKTLRKAKFNILFAHSSSLLSDNSAGRLARELFLSHSYYYY